MTQQLNIIFRQPVGVSHFKHYRNYVLTIAVHLTANDDNLAYCMPYSHANNIII